MSITKLNQQIVRKRKKGKKGKRRRVELVSSTDKASIKYKKHKTRPKKLGAAQWVSRCTHTPLYRQEKGQKLKKSDGR